MARSGLRNRFTSGTTRGLVACGATVVAFMLVAGCSSSGGNVANGNSSGSDVPTGSTTGGSADRGPIVLGATGALSGPVAAACVPLRDGAKAWISKVNASGGVNGRQIDFSMLDDNNEATKAVANVRSLLSKNVLAIFDSCGTPGASATAPIVNAAKVPYLFPYAAVNTLYEPTLPYVFSVLPDYAGQTVAITKYVIKKSGLSNPSVMLLQCQIPGYQQVVSEVKDAVNAEGGKYLGAEICVNGTTDYTPIALKVKAAKPDILAVDLGLADAAVLMKAFSGIGYFPPLAAAASPEAGEPFIAAGGYLAPKGSITMMSPIRAAGSEEASECTDALKQAGVEANAFSLFSCGTAQILTSVIESLGDNVTRDGIVDALEKLNDQTVSPVFPPLTFSKTQHLGLTSMFLATIDGKALATSGELVPVDTK